MFYTQYLCYQILKQYYQYECEVQSVYLNKMYALEIFSQNKRTKRSDNLSKPIVVSHVCSKPREQ